MEGLVTIYEKTNMTPEEITANIRAFHEITRAGIYICALSSGNEEIADKIKKANNILKERRINEFKEAIANGTETEFLSYMSWMEKISLKVDMEPHRIEKTSEKPLTEEEPRYLDIIEK